MNLNKSIFFKDVNKKEHFLFQIINFGQDDELKFIFNSKNNGTGILFSPDNTSNKSLVRLYEETTYHKDGIVQHKLGNKSYEPGVDRVCKKPFDQVEEWEPFLRMYVLDYNICRKSKSSDKTFLPENPDLFNGNPLEIIVYIGHMKYSIPEFQSPGTPQIIYRINNVIKNIDLFIKICRTSYPGTIIPIPNTNKGIISKNTVIQLVERI